MLSDRFSLPCRVRTTRRQGSIALRVSRHEIRILAPQGTPAAAIERLLQERQQWIETAIAAQQQTPRAERGYCSGETLLLAGTPYPLLTLPGARCQLEWRDGVFELRLPHPDTTVAQRRQAVIAWYQQRAEQEWPQRLQHWADHCDLHPQSLKIRTYKSRWGACTARGQVSLNTLLMLAPDTVRDYVIVHELCHLRHLNHSAAYWALVARHCPDFKARRHWLKCEGRRLLFD